MCIEKSFPEAQRLIGSAFCQLGKIRVLDILLLRTSLYLSQAKLRLAYGGSSVDSAL